MKKLEAGSPRITMGAYLSLLDIFGLPTAFDRVMAPGDDTLGEALNKNALRRRARQAPPAGGAPEDEWEI